MAGYNNKNTYDSTDNGIFGKWWFIILMLLIFWPVGIVLIIIKVSKDKKASMTLGIVMKIVGWCGVAFCAMMTAVVVSEPPIDALDIVLLVIMYVPCIIFIVFGAKTRKRAKLYKRYLNLIINMNMTQIDNIAYEMKLPKDKVAEDIKTMIDKKFLPNAALHGDNITIEKTAVEDKKYTSVVECPCCGAKNIVSADRRSDTQIGVCEYCGSVLKNK